jgi:hypothetical protein
MLETSKRNKNASYKFCLRMICHDKKPPLPSYKRPLAIAIKRKVGYRFSINSYYQFQYQHYDFRDTVEEKQFTVACRVMFRFPALHSCRRSCRRGGRSLGFAIPLSLPVPLFLVQRTLDMPIMPNI